eukprot:2510595-Pyramimonas_sp.AAC.1
MGGCAYLSRTPHAASPSGHTMQEGLEEILVRLKTLFDSGVLNDDAYRAAVVGLFSSTLGCSN